jgi:hypothetical protein
VSESASTEALGIAQLEPPMPFSLRRRAAAIRALRFDAAALRQISIAAGISFFVAWAIQSI